MIHPAICRIVKIISSHEPVFCEKTKVLPYSIKKFLRFVNAFYRICQILWLKFQEAPEFGGEWQSKFEKNTRKMLFFVIFLCTTVRRCAIIEETNRYKEQENGGRL
jgi:hypothetical protein